MRVVSAGPALFADTLEAQGVAVERVDWRPPADGDRRAGWRSWASGGSRIDEANQVAPATGPRTRSRS